MFLPTIFILIVVLILLLHQDFSGEGSKGKSKDVKEKDGRGGRCDISKYFNCLDVRGSDIKLSS